MKKYFSILIFTFSLFFLGLSTNSVSADDGGSMVVTVNQADPYDNRKIELAIRDHHEFSATLKITELRLCEDGESGCEKYPQAGEHTDEYMKIVGSEEIREVPQFTLAFSLPYTVHTKSDGNVFILIRAFAPDGSILPGPSASAFVTYKLSTLNQRIVINPNGVGQPTYTFDNVQYSAARNNSVAIELFEDELDEYTGAIYVCEYRSEKNERCLKYTYNGQKINYYIESYGDGEKQLNFYLIKKNGTLNNLDFNNNNSTLISKKLILDTVGPEITIEGGQWIYIEAGKKYTEQKATCSDAVFKEDDAKCVVTNDLKVVGVDYRNEKYQVITYEATDRLGNTSSVAVKIKVEIPTSDNSGLVAIVVSVMVFLVAISILGFVVYKNNQKKKKLSYI